MLDNKGKAMCIIDNFPYVPLDRKPNDERKKVMIERLVTKSTDRQMIDTFKTFDEYEDYLNFLVKINSTTLINNFENSNKYKRYIARHNIKN